MMDAKVMDKYHIALVGSELREQAKHFYEHFARLDIYEHTLQVMDEIHEIHTYHEFDMDACMKAALLHDLGRVVSSEDIVPLCKENGHICLPEELKAPILLHQRASKFIAFHVFGMDDVAVLDAIACHTTLKPEPSDIDKVVFISDKLSWQDDGQRELVGLLRLKSRVSLDSAILHFLGDFHQKRTQLTQYHPLTKAAYEYFSSL